MIGATYRLQLTPSFGLRDAADLADHLRALGITHVYSSPILQARPGSTHGYDVLDHDRVSDDLGGDDGFDALTAALDAHGMGLVLDIVPNHMAIANPGNDWWTDVLRHGRSSRFAAYFDIDWNPPDAKLVDRILVPVLADHYGRVVESGDLRVERRGGEIVVAYADLVFPLDPVSLATVIDAVEAAHPSPALALLGAHLAALPAATTADPVEVERRRVDTPVYLAVLAETLDDPGLAAAFDDVLAELSVDPDRLDALLSAQNYRLAHWRTSGQELDYRRFFDVDDLVGLHTESPEVFEAIHRRIFAWVDAGRLDGVRVDHVDGLADPLQYLTRLRSRLPDGSWILVEKILEPGEQLRSEWPVDGTTGYEFAALIGGLQIDPDGARMVADLWADVTGSSEPFEEVLRGAKHDVLREVLATEVNRLTEAFVRVGEAHRRFRDFSRHDLHETVIEVLASFPVYRSYLTPSTSGEGTRGANDDGGRPRRGPAAEDVDVIDVAIDTAVKNRPDLDPELFTLLRRVLLADDQRGGEFGGPRERELRARFQQVSPPVMAKAKEDTAFYRHSPLLALNEVGADPARLGVGLDELHAQLALTQRQWPAMMLGLTTHDSKRTEDVRARLALLSEAPVQWAAAVWRWHALTEVHRADAPIDPATEYYLYQTLVGAHPISRERVHTHLRKAIREAKRRTSWLAPDDEYEATVDRFIDALFGDAAFQGELAEFVAPLVAPGRVNALAQKLVQLTAPGIPDLYQGQELWDLSLVDPDNRRPVDFALRRRLLDDVRTRGDEQAGDLGDLADPAEPGRPKLAVVQRALAVRAERPDAFGPDATYEPLRAAGPDADRVVAFARSGEVVTVVPRLVLAEATSWEATTLALPPGTWTDVLTPTHTWSGPAVPLASLWSAFPAALLVRTGDG